MKLTAKNLLLFWFGTIVSHAQVWNFQHIVVIVQENRTPDNLFPGLVHLADRVTAPLQYNPKLFAIQHSDEQLAGQEILFRHDPAYAPPIRRGVIQTTIVDSILRFIGSERECEQVS
jgi:phospholipase C